MKKKLSLENLEKLFDEQLDCLQKLGCPKRSIQDLRSLRAQTLAASQKLSGDSDLPFVPVIGKEYLNIYKLMFLNKNNINLAIGQDSYQGWEHRESHYYLIGVKILNPKNKINLNSKGAGANVSEIISIALLSGLSGPFYAHRSRYIITAEDTQEKAISGINTGVWLNPATGTIGPFIKNGLEKENIVAPPIIIAGRVSRGF